MNQVRLQYQTFRRNKKFVPYVIGAVVVLIVIVIGTRFIGGGNSSAVQGVQSSQNGTIIPKAKQTLNKNLEFPIKDDKGKVVTKIKFSLLEAQLQDEIIVQGKRTSLVNNKSFLVITLKLRNDYSQGIKINTKDYIRLSVNKKDEKLAADFNNDPVLVQAISTKYTRLGFAISNDDKDITLTVGEIDGKKETISIKF